MKYMVNDERDRLDLDWIWRMLSTEVPWSRWRSSDDVRNQIAASWRVVGAYDRSTGDQIGFARAVSDGVAFAWLDDVIVDPGHRGNGLGKALVRAMIDDGPGAAFEWLLFTDDAHGLYRQFGFKGSDETVMVRHERR